MQLLPLIQRRETLGGWCAIPSALTAEIIGRIGFDWVCVDTQHGPIGTSDMASMLQALEAARVPSLVRVGWNEPARIYQALDAGAHGVIVPLVDSVEAAESAAQACRYPPEGSRSYGPTVAGVRDPSARTNDVNRRVACLVQIESEQALASANDIAAVEGVDGLLVGPADLALSLGRAVGATEDEGFREATRVVVQACRANGKVPAIFCGTHDAALAARVDGFRMMAVQSDVRFLRAAAAEALSKLRDTKAEQ